ncbi:MAG: DUF3179 domain-containing (seleno)protein [Pseudomonadota bacterium]
MIALFFATFVLLILLELLKGLSANGTPPVLQKYAWQMDLAHFMWSHIMKMRIALTAALIVIFFAAGAPLAMIIGAILLGAIWGGVWWVFNRFWVGKYKFLPITQKVFESAESNKIDPQTQVIGVDLNGAQKAFPVPMLFYHHQITDEVGGKPIWATYCGLCRSGRVYDVEVDGQALTFGLVGAITFNAVFRDDQSGSWWRQETGEAAKGPRQGRQLEDIAFEQMSLENWLAKYPESTVLQHDPTFAQKYNFLGKLLNYEVSLPGWHRQETPPLIIGVEVGGASQAYDWGELQKRGVVNDEVGGTPLLVMADEAGSSAFVYERVVGGEALDFERADGVLKDAATGGEWDQFGRCLSGPHEGAQLTQVQSYQQFLRSWISFHPGTTFYNF